MLNENAAKHMEPPYIGCCRALKRLSEERYAIYRQRVTGDTHYLHGGNLPSMDWHVTL